MARQRRQRHGSAEIDLDSLARDLGRSNTGDRLSAAARQRLFSSVTEVAEPGPLAVLFMPIRRLAVAAVLPALVVGVVLLGLGERAPLGTTTATVTTTVTVEKIGGDVVFRIANGGQAHRVSTAATANGFSGDSSSVSVHGEFRDRLAGGSNLVFYRID